jgi:hypothetical protein
MLFRLLHRVQLPLEYVDLDFKGGSQGPERGIADSMFRVRTLTWVTPSSDKAKRIPEY